MKKKLILLVLCLLSSCNAVSSENDLSSSENLNNSVSSIESSSFNSSGDVISSESFSSELESSSEILVSTSSSYEDYREIDNISEILEIGKNLNGEEQVNVVFNGIYAKKMTDNFDKLMLFVDSSGYVVVRVNNKNVLDSKYYNYEYKIYGSVVNNNGKVEVNYSSRENVSSTSMSFDYTSISSNKDSIQSVYDEFENVILNDKDTGVGSVVTFEGIVMATDESNSQKKVVVYDGNKTITVIDDKTICSKDNIGQKYSFTGVLSVLKTGPAIWLLQKRSIEKVDLDSIDLSSAVNVSPSYFSKWYYTSKKQSKPSYSVYASIYKITGYIVDDTSRTSAYYLGAVDSLSDSLNDSKIDTSIKGIYLMNNLNMDEHSLSYSPFYEYYINKTEVTFYASLYQFESDDHGWKMFAFNYTIK